MTSHIRRQWLTTASGSVPKTFGELKIGDEFFDPFCGEVFKKISDTQAECLTGGDAFEGEVDDFEPDDRVQPAE